MSAGGALGLNASLCAWQKVWFVCVGKAPGGTGDAERLSLSRITLIKLLLHWESILLEELQNYSCKVRMRLGSVLAFVLGCSVPRITRHCSVQP